MGRKDTAVEAQTGENKDGRFVAKPWVRLEAHHSPPQPGERSVASVALPSHREGALMIMDVKEVAVREQVGEAAGEVWRQLNQGGPQTLAQLKKKLNGSSELLDFAVGWLAREDKLEILKEKKSVLLQLK